MMSLPNRKTQASTKVHAYLDSLLATREEETIRLPSVRQLAGHLGVSTSTVATVYRNLKKDGRLESHAGSASHLKRDGRPRPQLKQIRVTTNLPMDEAVVPGSWYAHLTGGLTVAALESGMTLSLRSLDSMPDKTLTLSPAFHDVALLFPAHLYQKELMDWVALHRLPLVSINPLADHSTSDFVSSDYFGASRTAGHAFLRSGRRRILFIANFPYHLSASNRLRISGLLAGLEYGSDNGVSFEIGFTDSLTTAEAAAKVVLSYHEKHGTFPDAIYTPGDFMAIGAYETLVAHGVTVPQETSILGGTGLMIDRTSCPLLTRMSHPYEGLGREVIAMLLEQISHPGRPIAGRLLPMGWLGGSTTTEAENAFFFPALA